MTVPHYFNTSVNRKTIKRFDETGSHEHHHRVTSADTRVTSAAEDKFIRVVFGCYLMLVLMSSLAPSLGHCPG
ncbi:unnamed protein product [Oncorhynchus mykiss]|uniref:Uncharacterized protein n=1 Tax=Oncorhynchus mykiss TaxID=8022 RepID=A0A060XX17_ONCMY|nr:unnamed protein product [Oncorhynchus mykiss]